MPELKPSSNIARTLGSRRWRATPRQPVGAGEAFSEVIVDGKRSVVGEPRGRMDRAGPQARQQRRRHELVVDAPAHVLGAGGAAVAPPGVVLALGVQRAVGVDPAGTVHAQAIEPVAFGGEAAGVLLVGFPVPDVALAAHDVPVAAQHVVAPGLQPLLQDRRQPLHDLELEALAQLAGGTRRNVEGHHAEVAEARLDVAALVVERGPAHRGQDFVGFAAAVDGHAAVALLRARVLEPGAVAVRAEGAVVQLVLLRLGFLQAQDVGVLAGEPVEEALGGGRTQAVGVEADDAHRERGSLGECARLPGAGTGLYPVRHGLPQPPVMRGAEGATPGTIERHARSPTRPRTQPAGPMCHPGTASPSVPLLRAPAPWLRAPGGGPRAAPSGAA